MKNFSISVKKKINYFNKSIYVEGDKSISHRALLIASQSHGGITKISGLLEAEDVLNCIKALRKLGVKIIKKKNEYWVFGNGLGSFKINKNITINCGNAGTLARLIMGLLSSYPKKIKIVGDKSLNKRPMRRVIEPLEKFGCTFYPKNKKNLPIVMQGTSFPAPIKHTETIGSAQVKSAIQLSALNTPGVTEIIEIKKSRNHTENLLKSIGAKIKVYKKKSFNKIIVEGQKEFKFFKINISGDISSAAFFIVLTILNKNSKLKIKNVNLNSTRTGVIKILKKMKAKISLKNIKTMNGEKRGDITVKSSKLIGINCPSSLVPSAIDEFPIIMIAAAAAKGVSIFSGLHELEKKESPRLSIMNSILRKIDIKTKLKNNKIKIYGNTNINLKKTYKIKTFGDHRICMTAFIMAQLFGGKFNIKDCNSINTSFPKFLKLMKKIGAHYEIK